MLCASVMLVFDQKLFGIFCAIIGSKYSEDTRNGHRRNRHWFANARKHISMLWQLPVAILAMTIESFNMKYIVTHEISSAIKWHSRRLSKEMHMIAVLHDSDALQYVYSMQTPELCSFAVQQNGLALRFVRKRTPEICLEAVRQNGLALEYVYNQTTEMCLVAIQQTGRALALVRNQTPDICLAAVRRSGFALEFVRVQTPDICLAAVQQTPAALEYVKNKTPEICSAAAQQALKCPNHVKTKTD